MQCTRAEIDESKLLAELAARPRPSEKEIKAQASPDGDAWTDDELAEVEPVLPPPSPEEVRALRKIWIEPGAVHSPLRLHARLRCSRMSKAAVAAPALLDLLRVMKSDPDAVVRALGMLKAC